MPGTRLRLREATQQEHRRLERYPFFRAAMDQSLPKASYVAWLRAMTAIVAVLEQAAETAAHPAVSRLWRPEMRKLPLLRADAAFFDAEPVVADRAVAPVVELIETLRRWAAQDPARLTGVLYVFEGSNLGGAVLREKLAAQYGLQGKGVSWLSADRPSLDARWRAFCRRLDALELGEDAESRAVEAAKQVFRMLGRIVDVLYPLERDTYAVMQALNPSAGRHEGTNDPREIVACFDAGDRTLEEFPYLVERFGERGRLFAHSDSAWLVLLTHDTEESAAKQIDWLARLLAYRGMPSVLLETHLRRLHAALVEAVPERRKRYRGLIRLSDRLRSRRLAALPRFNQIARSFPLSQPLPHMGRVIASAVADERGGVDNAVETVESWLTDSERFPAEWIAAVRRTIARARQAEARD